MSVRPELWTVSFSTGNRVPRTNIACAFFDRSTNVLSVSYTVHIRCVRYASLSRTLVDRSLSVTCSAHMRSLRLPWRLPSPDEHFLQFFCPFGVRYLYPLICDSTIKHIVLPMTKINKFWLLFIFWYSETYSLTQKNGFSWSTLSMQNAKLRCCVQQGLGFQTF